MNALTPAGAECGAHVTTNPHAPGFCLSYTHTRCYKDIEKVYSSYCVRGRSDLNIPGQLGFNRTEVSASDDETEVWLFISCKTPDSCIEDPGQLHRSSHWHLPIYTVRNGATSRDNRTPLGGRDNSQRGKRPCPWPSTSDVLECVFDPNYAMMVT